MDGREIGHALKAQKFRQLVGRDARFPKILLLQLSVVHQHDRLSAEKAAHRHAVIDQHGEQQLNGQYDEDRDKPGEQGNALVLHGDGGQIGDEHGHDKFRRLHLPELAFAHEADDEDERQIEDHGARE